MACIKGKGGLPRGSVSPIDVPAQCGPNAYSDRKHSSFVALALTHLSGVRDLSDALRVPVECSSQFVRGQVPQLDRAIDGSGREYLQAFQVNNVQNDVLVQASRAVRSPRAQTGRIPRPVNMSIRHSNDVLLHHVINIPRAYEPLRVTRIQQLPAVDPPHRGRVLRRRAELLDKGQVVAVVEVYRHVLGRDSVVVVGGGDVVETVDVAVGGGDCAYGGGGG